VVIFPYIARRFDEEIEDSRDLVVDGNRVCYLTEVPADRDRHGVLWVRQADGGTGAPVFGQIHSRRQQHASIGLLCQVCGGEPDENEHGVLWLLPRSPQEVLAKSAGGAVLTPYPPICAGCYEKVRRQCPPVRDKHTLLRVFDVSLHGVLGTQFDARGDWVAAGGQPAVFAYDDSCIPMVVASQQVLSINEYQIVNT
jgi:hypothetical protein